MWDVVVIGAGLAGLTAARQLHQSGYRILVIEKSRGLGGRLATRRVQEQPIDHGCRFLQTVGQGPETLALLQQAGILSPWMATCYDLAPNGNLHPRTDPGTCLVAPPGMTAVAKALAVDLSIYRQCRVTRLQLTSGIWHLQWQDGLGKTQTTTARSIIAAIPAPQIMPLLSQAGQQSKMDPLLCQLARVQFDAVITVMAGYDLQQAPVPPNLPSIDRSPGWMIFGDQHDTLRWAGLDSSKRLQPSQAIIVLHSSARFAAHYLDQRSVPVAGREFLAAVRTQLGSWLTSPNWHQTHRWRYGFVTRAFDQSWVSHNSIPGFIACGDWCLGPGVEAALASGQRAAQAMMNYLGQPTP